MCMPMRAWVYACVFTCPCVYMWTCVMWRSQVKGRCLPPSLAWHLLFETKSLLESGAHWSVSWALGPRGLLVFSSHAHPARAVLQPHTTKSDFYWGLGSHSGPHAFAASSLPVESSCQFCSMGFDKWMVSIIPVLNRRVLLSGWALQWAVPVALFSMVRYWGWTCSFRGFLFWQKLGIFIPESLNTLSNLLWFFQACSIIFIFNWDACDQNFLLVPPAGQF